MGVPGLRPRLLLLQSGSSPSFHRGGASDLCRKFTLGTIVPTLRRLCSPGGSRPARKPLGISPAVMSLGIVVCVSLAATTRRRGGSRWALHFPGALGSGAGLAPRRWLWRLFRKCCRDSGSCLSGLRGRDVGAVIRVRRVQERGAGGPTLCTQRACGAREDPLRAGGAASGAAHTCSRLTGVGTLRFSPPKSWRFSEQLIPAGTQLVGAERVERRCSVLRQGLSVPLFRSRLYSSAEEPGCRGVRFGGQRNRYFSAS